MRTTTTTIRWCLCCTQTAIGRCLPGICSSGRSRTLLRRNADVSADILKVGNHGNPDATLEEFANAVGADIAVISTDTSADTDSANARVIAALGDAQIFVTENDPIGVMIGMGKDISAGYASIVNNY